MRHGDDARHQFDVAAAEAIRKIAAEENAETRAQAEYQRQERAHVGGAEPVGAHDEGRPPQHAGIADEGRERRADEMWISERCERDEPERGRRASGASPAVGASSAAPRRGSTSVKQRPEARSTTPGRPKAKNAVRQPYACAICAPPYRPTTMPSETPCEKIASAVPRYLSEKRSEMIECDGGFEPASPTPTPTRATTSCQKFCAGRTVRSSTTTSPLRPRLPACGCPGRHRWRWERRVLRRKSQRPCRAGNPVRSRSARIRP